MKQYPLFPNKRLFLSLPACHYHDNQNEREQHEAESEKLFYPPSDFPIVCKSKKQIRRCERS